MSMKQIVVLFIIGATVLFSSCIDKSGDGSGAGATPSNNWDTMVWDQGNWE